MKKKNNKKLAKDGLSPKGQAYNFYSYALKRKVVSGIRSRQSINNWIKKYSSLNYRITKKYGMKESPEEKIKRLEAENASLKEDKIILNIAIDIADEQFNAQIRKKYLPQQLARYKGHKKRKDAKK